MTEPARTVELAPEVDARAAQRAWSVCGGRDASRISALSESRRGVGKSTVFLLEGAGPDGADVVAKRSRSASISVEAQMLRALAPLDVPVLRCFGSVDSTELGAWLFMGAASGRVPDLKRRGDDRIAVSEWVGELHRKSRDLDPADLPERGEEHQCRRMAIARSGIAVGLRNPSADASTVRFLEGVEEQLESVESRWAELIDAMSLLPPCLVHGDLVPKNVLLESSPSGDLVHVFDWETGGWGPPITDLAKVDLDTYLAVVGTDLPRNARTRLRRTAEIFRYVAAIGWEATHLRFAYLDDCLRLLATYSDRLENALDGR